MEDEKNTLEEELKENNTDSIELEDDSISIPVEENKIEESNIQDDSLEIKEEPKKGKKPSRKERKIQKLKNIINGNDINYIGKLSYRHLRIIAWIAFACLHISSMMLIYQSIYASEEHSQALPVVFSTLGGLATPLFLVATYSTIFNGKKSYKSILIFYLACFLGIGLGFSFIVGRYIISILSTSQEYSTAVLSIGDLLGSKIQINVFADLFFITLFSFFINYNPVKFFKDKIVLFRSLAIIPVLYLATSYLLKVLHGFDIIGLPYFIYPFLTTKSPFVHIIFMIVAIWIKRRERTFVNIGSTTEYYRNVYINTKSNSLSYSWKISKLFLIFGILDLIVLFVAVFLMLKGGIAETDLLGYIMVLEFGDNVPLILAIPFVMLFSYTKVYDDTKLDLLIPIAGIGLTVLVYLESIYQIVMHSISKA